MLFILISAVVNSAGVSPSLITINPAIKSADRLLLFANTVAKRSARYASVNPELLIAVIRSCNSARRPTMLFIRTLISLSFVTNKAMFRLLMMFAIMPF